MGSRRNGWRLAERTGLVAAVLLAAAADGATFRADPETYRARLGDLGPGDTLQLEPGWYRDGLPLRGIRGEPGRPIVIEGPRGREAAVFIAPDGRPTISLVDVSHVTLCRLRLEGGGVRSHGVLVPGTARFAHDVTLVDLQIAGYDRAQGYNAISTKAPAWNWVIRGNRIRDVGTGMYLGRPDGTAPFVGGLIEGNVIERTIGYNVQIKHQAARPALRGLSELPTATVIRGNVFSKAERGSGGTDARPNLLLGHWPLVGPGSNDRYLVHHNLFLDNPNERLLQAEGHVAIYNNVMFNPRGDAVSLQAHNDRPRTVDFLANTVVASGAGVRLTGADPKHRQRISGNRIYADRPLHVPPEVAAANREASFDEGWAFLRSRQDRPARLWEALRTEAGSYPAATIAAEDGAQFPGLRPVLPAWEARPGGGGGRERCHEGG